MKIWLEVSNDKYEFPLIIADSSFELAKLCGVSYNTIKSCASKYKNGYRKKNQSIL